MIYFCEDCGHRNIIDIDQAPPGEEVRCRCSACDYPNMVTVNKTSTERLAKKEGFRQAPTKQGVTKKALEEINAAPHVRGACLYQLKRGAVAGKIPVGITREDINNICEQSLTKPGHQTAVGEPDTQLICKQIYKELFVVVCCEAVADIEFLTALMDRNCAKLSEVAAS